MSKILLIENQIFECLERTNIYSLNEAKIDCISLGFDEEIVHKIYEATNNLFVDFMLIELQYGIPDNQSILNEKFLDTFASKAKGAAEFVKQLSTGGGLTGAKTGYNASSVNSRSNYFKNAIGDALYTIKNNDKASAGFLVKNFGPIQIKPSKGAGSQFASDVIGYGVSGAKTVAAGAASGAKAAANIAGQIKDKSGNVVKDAYLKSISAALSKYFNVINGLSKLKSKLSTTQAYKLLDNNLKKIAPSFKTNSIYGDTNLDKLRQIAKNNPGWTNVLIGLTQSLIKWGAGTAIVAGGVAGATAVPAALAASVICGIIMRTWYGVYIKKEPMATALKKAVIVALATLTIGSLVKGLTSMVSGGNFLSGVKTYFVGVPDASQSVVDTPAKQMQTQLQAVPTSGAGEAIAQGFTKASPQLVQQLANVSSTSGQSFSDILSQNDSFWQAKLAPALVKFLGGNINASNLEDYLDTVPQKVTGPTLDAITKAINSVGGLPVETMNVIQNTLNESIYSKIMKGFYL